jgi:hypothetical protein
MEAYLVPVGFRCNAACITKEIVDQPRFVFDWVQMDIDSMVHIIHLKSSEIRTYWETYFSELDEKKYHKTTGSWFPHDSFESEKEKALTVEKYIRRTERFHQVLKTNIHVYFLIFHGFPDIDTLHKSKHLITEITFLKSTNISFIVCNSIYENIQMENIYLLFEPLYQVYENSDKDWDDLTNRLTTRIKLLLKDKNTTIVPFPLKEV